jgi:hypothetical protein
VDVQAWHGERWQRESGGDAVQFPVSQAEFSRATVVFKKR